MPSIKKCYIVAFVCQASRAIHLELMLDRTTESFLLSVKRFCNRRGTPRIFHSDNGKELLKGRNVIQETYQKINNEKTHRKLAEKFNITWYTIPFYKSRANGAVERLIQSVKRPLYKTLNGKILSESELYTVLTDIESAINNRPLTPLSEHPDDNNIIPLTPAHLLLGKGMNALPRNLASGYVPTRQNANIRARWKDRTNIAEHFWKIWKNEYMLGLRKRTKDYLIKKDIKVGDLVLLNREIKANEWPIAVVSNILPTQQDGKVRTVEVRRPLKACQVKDDGKPTTSHIISRRGINDISLLEEVVE